MAFYSTATVANYNSLLSSTYMKYVSRNFEDNIFNANVLLMYMKQNGRTLEGGESIAIPLMYSKSTDVQRYSGYGLFTVTPQDPFTMAIYDWKEYLCTVAISEREMAQNAGESALINLLQSKIEHAEQSFADAFEGDLFAGDASDSLRIKGLVQHIATTGTVGGISKSTYSWWQAKSQTASDFNGVVGTGDGIPKMTTLYADCSQSGSNTPKLIIGDETFYTVYEGLLVPYRQYVDSRLADAGFDNLKFKNCVVTWSSQATSTKAYFLNPQYLYLISHARFNMKAEPMISLEAVGQAALAGLIKWKGELVCSRADRQGILNGTNT